MLPTRILVYWRALGTSIRTMSTGTAKHDPGSLKFYIPLENGQFYNSVHFMCQYREETQSTDPSDEPRIRTVVSETPSE